QLVKSGRLICPSLQNQGNSRIPQGQAGQAGVQETLDLFLSRFREMGDIFTTDHHNAVGGARFEEAIGYVDPGTDAGTIVRDIESHGLLETHHGFELDRGRGLKGESDGAVGSGDVATDK